MYNLQDDFSKKRDLMEVSPDIDTRTEVLKTTLRYGAKTKHILTAVSDVVRYYSRLQHERNPEWVLICKRYHFNPDEDLSILNTLISLFFRTEFPVGSEERKRANSMRLEFKRELEGMQLEP